MLKVGLEAALIENHCFKILTLSLMLFNPHFYYYMFLQFPIQYALYFLSALQWTAFFPVTLSSTHSALKLIISPLVLVQLVNITAIKVKIVLSNDYLWKNLPICFRKYLCFQNKRNLNRHNLSTNWRLCWIHQLRPCREAVALTVLMHTAPYCAGESFRRLLNIEPTFTYCFSAFIEMW